MGQAPAGDGNDRLATAAVPRRRQGAARRSLLLLAGVFALLVGIFVHGAWRDYEATLESGWQSAERGALGAAEHARRTLSVARLLTMTIVQYVGRDGFGRIRGEGWDDLAALVEVTPEVTALWVTDAQGTIVATSIDREPPRANWAGRPFFAPLREGADSVLMPLTWGVITRNWYLSFSVAIRDRAGRFLGIAQSALFTDDFRRAYAELELPQGARAGVFRAGDGAPMILWPPPPAAESSGPAPRPAESDILARLGSPAGTGEGGLSGRVEFDGAAGPMVLAWRRFDEGEALVGAMVMQRAAVLAPFHERLRRNGLILLASILPLGALGWTTARAQRRAVLSEARFRGTFEQAAVGVANVGLDGSYLQVNARLCQMLGYSEAELLQRNTRDVTHPDDQAQTREQSDRVLRGEISSFTQRKRYLRKDGTVMQGELTASMLRDEASGRPLHGVVVVQDIGERVAAEAALAASEERLALASAAAGMGVYDVDLRTGDAVVSAQYRRVYGLPPGQEVLSRARRTGFVHPDDREQLVARRAASHLSRTDFYEEFRIVRQDTGEVRWVASRGSYVGDGQPPTRFVGVTYDVTDRVAADEARAESERRLALACEAVGLGVFDVDTESGFANVNAEWRRLFGLAPSDAPVSIEERFAAVHPDDRAHVRASTLRAYAQHDGYDQEFRIVRHDTGAVRWMHSRGAFVDSGPRPHRFLGLIHDITDRRMAEAARAESEERLALASAAAGMGVFDVDTRTGIAVVNDQWRRVYGLPPGDGRIAFRRRMALVLEEDRARVRRAVRAAYETGTPYAVEFRIRRKDSGEVRWLAARGSYVGDGRRKRRFLGVTYDITDRKLAEAARAASDERLAMASVAAGIGVWEVDTATGMAEVNDEYRRLYFLPPGTAPLTRAERLVHVLAEDRERLRGHLALIDPAQRAFAEEFRVVDPAGGEVRWIAERGSVIGGDPAGMDDAGVDMRGGDARVGRVVGVSLDITERKQEQEREMLLAREVDHRARNVLAVVRSIVKLSRADSPRQFADAVEGRVSALARAHTLLARDRWTGADIADVAREELAAYGTAEGDGTDRVRLDGPKLRLRPDVVQPLSMVLHELATNAAKYGALSTATGHVSLSWRLAPAPSGGAGRILVVWQEGGGPGLVGPPTRRGFGSIVVEATVHSQLGGEVARHWTGEGLRCEIAIPADRALGTGAEEVAREAVGRPPGVALAGAVPAPALHRHRVLVVEDEPIVALEIATTLAEADYEVVGPAATLAEALALAEAQVERLDAAVLDANLHGQSSRPVAGLLAGRGVPVIYVTGYSSLPPGVPEGQHLLSKPLRDGDLLAALRSVLRVGASGGRDDGGVSPAGSARPATASADSPS